MYQLPQFNSKKSFSFFNKFKNKKIPLVLLIIVISSFSGFLAAAAFSFYFYFYIVPSEKLSGYFPFEIKRNLSDEENKTDKYSPLTFQEEAVIKAVKKVSPAVVSIVISKDAPVLEKYYYNPFKDFEQFFGQIPFEYQIPKYRQKGTEKREIGGGTGVIVSQDGVILTNKHVVLDKEADYTVFTSEGTKFSAKVLARDPVQDLAVLKIEKKKTIGGDGELMLKPFSVAKLGNSDGLEIGQSVIAIGNALAEFRNTVSVGVISGLGRKLTASGGGGFVEVLEDIIQTDAAINKGNSGGPLVNLKGEVIGINTAMASGAQSIGFAIPINKAKRDIKQIKTSGEIIYPFLGVRYVLVNEKVKKENNLTVSYGALIIKGKKEEKAIWPGSAAEEAGLKEGDVILEFGGEKITQDNSLAKIIAKYNPGDKVALKFLRRGAEKTIEVILGKRSE